MNCRRTTIVLALVGLATGLLLFSPAKIPGPAVASASSEQAYPTGDINADCVVDQADFDFMTAVWGSTEGSSNWDDVVDGGKWADLGGDAGRPDGVVDIHDFSILLSHWGERGAKSPHTGLDPCSLRRGDILVERGGNSVDKAFISLGGTYFTHTGLYLGHGMLAEARGYSANDAEEVAARPIEQTTWWDGDIDDWAVVRPSASDDVKKSAVRYAYDKASDPGVTFSIGTDRWNETYFYCSKLAWKAYLQAGVNVEAYTLHWHPVLDWWVMPDDLYRGSPVLQKKDASLGQRIYRGIWGIYSPGHLTLVDSMGRRTGFDPSSGGSLDEIPGAFYSGPDAEVETITATDVDGDAQLVITGFDSGEYAVEADYVDDQDPRSQVISGSIEPGETDLLAIPDPDTTSEGEDIIVPIDNTPPVTTAALDPPSPDGEHGSYVSDVTVTLAASDPPLAEGFPGSGVDVTRYRVNGEPLQSYNGPFAVGAKSGDNVVEFYSEDVAGNVEATKEVRFKLEGAPTPTPTPSPTPTVLPTVSMPMVAGWNSRCYIGEQKSIEEALAGMADKVRAVYTLNSAQEWGRWFPGKPDLSTITTLKPYDQLFVLMSANAEWVQEPSTVQESNASLVQGWNAVCYTGQEKAMADATLGMAGKFSILYMLSDQAWGRYVPGRSELSDISQLKPYDSVLILVTQAGGAQWVFDR